MKFWNTLTNIELIKMKIGALEKARKTCTDSKIDIAIQFWIAEEKQKLTLYRSN